MIPAGIIGLSSLFIILILISQYLSYESKVEIPFGLSLKAILYGFGVAIALPIIGLAGPVY
jgi:hypothetical protein